MLAHLYQFSLAATNTKLPIVRTPPRSCNGILTIYPDVWQVFPTIDQKDTRYVNQRYTGEIHLSIRITDVDYANHFYYPYPR